MGAITSFPQAKLVMGVIAAPDYTPLEILQTLESVYGKTDYLGDIIPFHFTDYYTAEMGRDLYRYFISFRELVCPSKLSEYKILSNRTERKFMRGSRRMVNLDPGILTLHSLILASTKDHSHRIPLNEGIYAELTLLYEKGSFRDLPWTYPDYRTEEYKANLIDIRNILHEQLKQKD